MKYQFCPSCKCPYTKGACENPGCLENPALTDGARQIILARKQRQEAERKDLEFRKKMLAFSMQGRRR